MFSQFTVDRKLSRPRVRPLAAAAFSRAMAKRHEGPELPEEQERKRPAKRQKHSRKRCRQNTSALLDAPYPICYKNFFAPRMVFYSMRALIPQ